MKRALVIASLALATTLGGCAVTPVAYYGPPRAVIVQSPPPAVVVPGPTIYPPQYMYRPNFDNGYARQRRWNSWYACQQYYGNSARCVY